MRGDVANSVPMQPIQPSGDGEMAGASASLPMGTCSNRSAAPTSQLQSTNAQTRGCRESKLSCKFAQCEDAVRTICPASADLVAQRSCIGGQPEEGSPLATC